MDSRNELTQTLTETDNNLWQICGTFGGSWFTTQNCKHVIAKGLYFLESVEGEVV